MNSPYRSRRVRSTAFVALLAAGVGVPFVLHMLSDPSDATAQDEGGAEKAAPTSSGKAAKADRAKLEKEFSELLTNATFIGKWRLVQNGKIGEERSEKYTLGSVRKLEGQDKWVIEARIEYGDKDFKVPVKVDVKWAGDTPVIQVTDWGVPLLGVGPYTARVMVYKGMYTGTWFGKNVGGLMSGEIVSAQKSEKAKEPAAQ